MTKPCRIISIILLLCTLSLSIYAQDTKPKERWIDRFGRYVRGVPWQFDSVLPTTHTKYLARVGQTGIVDEYLSPISHTGLNLGLAILTDGCIHNPEDKWHYYGEIAIGFGMPKNPSNNTTLHTLSGSYMGGAAYRALAKDRWAIDIAPAISLNIQGNMKMSNSNNIFNIKGDLGLDAWARVMYRIPWQVMPISFSYSMQLPIFHIAYHPQYGQSYYDYVSGENRVGPHFYPASLHNTLGIRQRLLIDLPLRSTTMTLGFEHSYFKQNINSTKYRIGDWSFVLGISLDHLTFSGNRSTRSQQILSPMYTR